MKIYRNASNEIREDDRIQAYYKGKPYQGIIYETEPEDDVYLVTFDEYDQLSDQASKTNNKDLYALLDWMEKQFRKHELKLIKPATRWEEIKSPTNLDLVNPETFSYYMSSWDVRAAKRLIHENPRPISQFPVIAVENYVSHGRIAISDQYKQANLNIPIICISNTKDENSAFPIDGWHRIKKAIEENIEYLPAYILTPEESKQIKL